MMFEPINVVCVLIFVVSGMVISWKTLPDFEKDPKAALKKNRKWCFLMLGIVILIRLVYDAVLV